MTRPRQLPDRPDLEQLRRQAKELLRSARNGEPAALARFRALPALARASDEELARRSHALHDAQSVIAREYGFPSWKALHEHVEERTLELGAALDEFILATTAGRSDRAERLLALYPALVRADFVTALLLGDVAAADSRLTADPGLVRQPVGPRDWEPLLYLCHMGLLPSARPEGVLAVAQRLLELGADANARYPWLHHGVRRPALWGAVCVTRRLDLAGLLLEHGADPNDGVTLPLAASGGDVAALELLRAHGADVNQAWATDGAATLYALLTWGSTAAGVRWLLEHGADADPVFAENGETPLHVVARRWDTFLAEMLVSRGADVSRRRADGRTPYAVAELHGNRAVADWLLEHGADGELSEVDRLVAACSRGDRGVVEAMLAARPSLREQIGPEHYVALYQAAERDDVPALECLLACGFDPNHGDDEIGKTPLHAAAMAGRPDAVGVLLAHGASVTVRDREFHAQPLVWAAEASRAHTDGRDYAAVARLLLEAGSPLEWEPGEEPADELLDILEEWRRALPAAR